MADGRPAVHAYLTDDAHNALHEFVAEEGISLTGLLQALGDALAEGDDYIEVSSLVKPARQVDVDRRRRNRRK